MAQKSTPAIRAQSVVDGQESAVRPPNLEPIIIRNQGSIRMPIVAISVDCEAASASKCYTREIVQAAEEAVIPLTWLIYVSGKDPMSNVNLYHAEYYHRIPSWHEYGLLLGFENSGGYVSEPKERADLIRLGKDVLKQCHVKPTSFRAHRFDLLPSDLRCLEDIGILVDSSSCPGAQDKHGVKLPDGPTQPFRPSYKNLANPGDAKIVMAPIATHRGASGYLDHGWYTVLPLIEDSIAHNDVTVLAMTDTVDCAETLVKTAAFCKEKGAHFVTLTQLAAIHS
jgi:hypothetical protein